MTYQRDTFDPNLNNIHSAMAYNTADGTSPTRPVAPSATITIKRFK